MSHPISRRALVASTAAAAFHVLGSRKGFSQPSRAHRVTVHTAVEGGTIRPDLHGHFAEHLGSCTYGGLWVGKNSPIPNIDGYRKQAVEDLRALGIPVLRWPGGCFADDYHWRDGIGPAGKRPRRVNLWWGEYTEDNSFGTHEFLGLCKLIGAEPYLAGNVGSGTPRELRDWMEYSNFPSGSTLSDERIANGARDPFRVRFWGVGNENWGCGGRMTPEEYAHLYRRYATYLQRGFGEPRPYLIACGPSSNDLDWSRRFLGAMTPRRLDMMQGFAMHFYSHSRTPALQYTPDTHREQMSSFDAMEKAVVQQHDLLRSFDPDGKVGLLIDEWGVWDGILPEDEKRYGKLFQPITMRSAVGAALGLNVFHRHAARVAMGNIAQIVNVLHSLLITDGPRCVRTTTYYAFELLKPHRGNVSLRLEAPARDPMSVSVSASRSGNTLIVTCVNPKHDEAAEVEIALAGAEARSATARLLHHANMNAANTFEQPTVIVPKDHRVEVARGALKLALPALGIATATVTLG